jgi:hypothetical protein
MIASKRSTHNAEHSSKAAGRKEKAVVKALHAIIFVGLCRRQSLAVKPVKQWQNDLRLPRVVKYCGHTLLDGTCCHLKIRNANAV